MKHRSSLFAFTLIELLVVISIIAILAGIALPVFSQVTERGAQTKDLSNAKQVGLACKLYAGDNDGKYPSKNGKVDPAVDATNQSKSNEVLASLIPDYLPTEKIFYLAKSTWSPTLPDENIAQAADRCEAKSNNFAYMFGLNDTSNPSYPLVFDAPMEGATTYSTNEATKGGVWKGKKAVVIRCDQSGAVEKCKVDTAAGTSTLTGPTGGATQADILVPAKTSDWLDARLRELAQTRWEIARQRAAALGGQMRLRPLANILKLRQQELSRLRDGMSHQLMSGLEIRKAELNKKTNSLRILSPLATLERGYSITTTEAGKPVISSQAVPPGITLRTLLRDGELQSVVTKASLSQMRLM